MDEEEDGKRQDARISDVEAGAMLGVAFLFDAAQGFIGIISLTPVIGLAFSILGTVVSLAGYTGFTLWFAYKGVNFLFGRGAAMRLVALFGSLVIELMPFLNVLPAITGAVLLMIVASRIKDTVGGQGTLKKMARKRTRAEALMDKRHNERLKRAEKRGSDAAVRKAKEQNEKERRELKARQEIEANQMAAKVYRGRRDVTEEEARTGISDLQGGMRDIVRAAPGTPEAWQEDPNGGLRLGDRVRITDAKYAALGREGMRDRFPSREGMIMQITSRGYMVQFGTLKQEMQARDIERTAG